MKTIVDEGIKDLEKYTRDSGYTKEKLQKAVDAALKKIDKAIVDLDGKFPSHNSENNVYLPDDNTTGGWNQGFWTGILWLAYELTGDGKYKNVALSHIPSFYERIDKKIGVDHHDMGFLYIPSCVAAYKLCGSEQAKEAALMAANQLMSRYHEKGKFIQAWGAVDDPGSYRLIVDCLLNIPLLYWASGVTGDKRYDEVAYNHFRTTLENAFREDGSTFHTFYFDPETGAPLRGVTHQGHSNDSCWARGQAWGIYGTMLTRAYHDDADIVPVTQKAVNFFLNRMPEDYVAYWDIIFGDGSGEPRDSSASAIAVCGMLEMIKYMPDGNEMKAVYENAVKLIMNSLYENYSTKDCPESNGLLLHATYGKPQGVGVDECNIWGCYFYMEALTRLSKDWNLYWSVISMGLFSYNYDKPGPGVPDNLPPKKGIGLFFDILVRKFSKLIGINILYALCSLPVFAVYFLLGTVYLNPILPAIEGGGASPFILCMAISVLLMLLLGGGVITPGLVYVLRCFVRGEHAFVASDFFEHIKKNLKQSIPVMLIDFVLVFMIFLNFNIFMQFPQLSMFRIPICVISVIYCIARMYLYILMVTFKAPLIRLFKFSLMLCMYRLPQNLLMLVLTAGLYIAGVLFLPYPIVLFIITPLILYSLLMTMQMVYTYSVVEKTLDMGEEKEKPERIFED